MKHEELILDLQQVAQELGITVRFEKGDFEGGYCILKDSRVVLVNKRILPARKAAVMALALNEIGLDDIFIKPAVRGYIEDEVARAVRAAR